MMKEIIETKYTVYNKQVAVKYGIYASILLGELISLHDYYEQKKTLSASGDFYVSANYIKESVGLSRYNQQVAIDTLVNAGLITIYLENNNLKYFHLNEEKICEITGFEGGAKNGHPLLDISTPCQNLAGGVSEISKGGVKIQQGGCQNLAPINKEYIINNKNNNIDNNIGAQKNFCSPDALRASTDTADAETGLSVDGGKKSKRKSQKQKRYEEVMTSPEFTATLCRGIESESAKQELISLWGEYVELRCSKDYKAFTDGAVKRNLNVLEGTSLEERKEIISKSVTKGRTGLFPLNDYDKKRLVTKEANVEGSDERLYNSILKMNCQEREELIPQGTLHKYLMELCEQYGKDKIRDIYYNRVRPEIKSIYGIKRDWVSH